jgi:hypothetical protein
MLKDFDKAYYSDELQTLTWLDLQDMTSKFSLALEDIAYITEGVWKDGRWTMDDGE